MRLIIQLGSDGKDMWRQVPFSSEHRRQEGVCCVLAVRDVTLGARRKDHPRHDIQPGPPSPDSFKLFLVWSHAGFGLWRGCEVEDGVY